MEFDFVYFLFNFLFFQTLFKCYFSSSDNERTNLIINFKRKASNTLIHEGVHFDLPIHKINFSHDPSLLDTHVSDSILITINSLLDDRLNRIGDQEATEALKFSQTIFSNFWSDEIPYVLHGFSGENEKLMRDSLSLFNKTYSCQSFFEVSHHYDKNKIIYKYTSDQALTYADFDNRLSSDSIVMTTADWETVFRLTLHALGVPSLLWRKDRDRFLSIHWANIKDEHKYNFFPWPFASLAHLEKYPFDFESVLHYDYSAVLGALIFWDPDVSSTEDFTIFDKNEKVSDVSSTSHFFDK